MKPSVMTRLGLWLRGTPPDEDQRLRALLRQTPISAMTDLWDDRPGRVVGKVVAKDLLRAPFSGQPCVYYHLVVGQHQESVATPFEIEDSSGRATVDPVAAWVSLDHRLPTYALYVEAAWNDLRQALERVGHRHGQVLTVSEGRIEPGDRIAIVGGVARAPAPSLHGDYRRSVSSVLRMVGVDGAPIAISNAPEALSCSRFG